MLTFRTLNGTNLQIVKKYKIDFLIVYLGDVPTYIDLFIESCRYNPDFRFIIFTEQPLVMNVPENVSSREISLDSFEQLASEKLGVSCAGVERSMKINDFKPYYAVIFDEFIEAEYWGYIDVDIILGDLLKSLTDIHYDKYDVISFWKNHVAGPLTIFRNLSEVNRLFEQSPDWQKVVQSKKHFMFDECAKCTDPNVKLYTELGAGRKLLDFQTEVEGITHAVLRAQRQSELKYYAQDMIKELVHSRHIVQFDRGTLILFDKNTNRIRAELPLFHFRLLKEQSNFEFPDWESIPGHYYFDGTSFYHSKLPRLFFILRYWFDRFFRR